LFERLRYKHEARHVLLYAFYLLELDGEDLRREPFETRNLKGPGSFDASGIPLHEDNQTVVKERIYLDKANRTSCTTKSPPWIMP
jgi:hypothetical protein